MIFRRRTDRDFAEEIRSHLDLETERLRAQGLPEDEARRLARRAFGNVTSAREKFYEGRRILFLDTLIQDTRYALRTLGRSPGYAVAAILTLALGIGANTAIFNVIDEVLFRPPDVPEAGRLMQVYSLNRKTSRYLSSSYPDYVDFREQARSFENLAAYVRLPLNVQLDGEAAERISVEGVSGNYFAMLEVAPLAGRSLAPEDDAAGAAPVAMIAEDLWRARFHADPAMAGKSIRIAGRSFTIVGVVSHRVGGFNLNWATPPRIWIPLHASALVVPGFHGVFASRGMIWLVLMGRLKEGVTPGAAQAELQSIAANIAGNRDLTAAVYPLSRSKFWPSYRKDIRTSLSGFGIASGLILLLACANVSNLMLGRAMGRRREVAVRLAIGAGRGRIVRQLLTESAVLAALSCGAALAVAHELMQLLLRFPNALGLPLALDLHVESRALAFCIALSAITVVLFGLVPALHSARLTIVPSLKESGNAAAGGRHHWFRGGLVAVQAALSMILLVGGGLYGRTLWKAYSADLGFRGDHLLTAAFSLPPPGSDQAERMWSAQRTLIERLRATPGVISAALSSTGILSPGRPQARVGREAGPEPEFSADYEFVSGDFFKTMGIPLLEGRGFRAHGKESAAAAIVNRTLARRLSPRGSLVGQTLLVDAPRQPKSRVMVVGVAGDARYDSVWDRAEPRLYFPARQRDVSAGFVLVRTGAPPADLAEPLGKLWGELAPESPLYEIQTAGERLNLFLTPQRVAAGILGAFAALALVLTAVGLYSVVAFSVAQQKREIGIRVAIGAQPREVFAGVLRRSMIPALAGLAAGAAASLPLMRILAAKAREVSPYDVPTYLAVAAVLAMVACAAAVVPARRAMRVDPAAALRAE